VWSAVSFWPNLSFVVNVTKISKLAKTILYLFVKKQSWHWSMQLTMALNGEIAI